MKKIEQLYEGKAKKVWTTEDPELLIVDYKDDATAGNGAKKGTIHDKGIINNLSLIHIFGRRFVRTVCKRAPELLQPDPRKRQPRNRERGNRRLVWTGCLKTVFRLIQQKEERGYPFPLFCSI